MVSAYNFAQALANFAANLKNNLELATIIQGYEAVKMQVNNKGMLIVTKAETFKKEASILEGKLKDAENELKQTKKTVSTQEKTIEDLTAQLKEVETISEEPKEIVVYPTQAEAKNKNTFRKKKRRKNQVEDS